MKKTALVVALAFASISTSSMATFQIADARSKGMGNTGVVSADYLLAPFHNPALGALYQDKSIGILFPAMGFKAHDKDETIDIVDDAQELYDRLDASNAQPPEELAKLNNLLNDLNNNAPLNVVAGVNFAVAIPNNIISVNIFAGGFVDIISGVGIGTGSNALDRYDSSTYQIATFGMTELGFSLSKNFTILDQKVAFGISPKYQKLVTYSQKGILDDFDIDNYDESEVSETAFNTDLGAVWYVDTWHFGLAIKNLFSQEIDTQVGDYTYQLEPQATIGLGYVGKFFTANVDLELTKQKRFKELDDDTQFLRFGGEMNAWDWAQLRLGYEIDMENTYDDAITAGIGFSPLDVVSLDLAGSIAGKSQFGASLNLSITF